MSALSTIVNSSSTSPKGKQTTISTTVLSNGSSTTATAVNQPTPTVDAKNHAIATSAEDVKYKRKYKDLKKRIRDIEDDNDVLNIKLSRARKNVHRLRVERSFLFDKLDQSESGTQAHPSASSSSSTNSDTDERNGGDSSRKNRHRYRHGLDRFKHLRLSHHNSSNSHHDRNGPSNVLAPPPAPLNHQARSKTPPSRGSSITGSAQHSLSPSIGGSMSSSAQVMHISHPNSLSPVSGQKKAIKKRRKDPLAPKRPSNAFFIFSQQHRQQAREEKKEGNQSELTKFLGQQWKSMPSTEKKIYSELAIQDRQRYLEEMSQYQYEQGHGVSGLEDTTLRKRKPGKPGRPPKSVTTNVDTIFEPLNAPLQNNGRTTVKSNKMDIHTMVNGHTEGDDMTSHDDEDDIRMGVSDDEHDDDDDDEAEHDHQHDMEDEEQIDEGESDRREEHVPHGHHSFAAEVMTVSA
ncbi:Tyrosine-protein phosphatase dsp1 [Mortierella sp. GBA30]|nr:Tyrosine-protein phosphatase dsp1 [Mortierella sp. GBA30]